MRKIHAIIALLLISWYAFGEGRIKISGYVRDSDGNPLELVNVRVKNTLVGGMTNEKGYYSYSSAEDGFLYFSQLAAMSSANTAVSLITILGSASV